jgi:hypothetical protein
MRNFSFIEDPKNVGTHLEVVRGGKRTGARRRWIIN